MFRVSRKTIVKAVKSLSARIILSMGLVFFAFILPAIMIILSLHTVINGILN